MPETLSETKACGLLARLFRSRGYTIARNVMFREYGVTFHIDGWDGKARVGFEFLTSEDEDHDDLSLEEYQTLMAAQQRGEIALFILDEVEPLSAAELLASARAFLDEVEAARTARRTASRSRGPKQAAARKAAVKKAVPRHAKAQKAKAKKAVAQKAGGTKATGNAAGRRRSGRRVR